MTYLLKYTLLIFFFVGCNAPSEIQKCGDHYQKYNDYSSLKRVVELFPIDGDTVLVKSLLGKPIDMGFDYRYLVDSTGGNGCVIGAVFHINESGTIDQKWIDEICE